MSLKIAKSNAAAEDLIDIWIYSYNKWGAIQADKYLGQLDNGFQLLAENPDVGINCEDIRPGYYSFPIKKHIIFYKVESKSLRIIRVLGREMDHQRQIIETPIDYL